MKAKEQIIATILSHKTQLTELGIREIGLFGSYVRNENTPASDIDLLIDFENEKEICCLGFVIPNRDHRICNP